MILDFVSGLIKSAVKSKNIKNLKWLSSTKATKGFLQKSLIVIVLIAFKLIGYVSILKYTGLDISIIYNIYHLFYGYALVNETISIFENMSSVNEDYKNFKGGLNK